MSMYDVVVPFVAKWEGLRLYPYFCSADKPTIGYGEVIRSNKQYGVHNGSDLINYCNSIRKKYSKRKTNNIIRQHYGSIITKEKAKEDLIKLLKEEYWYKIRRYLPQGMTDNQCAAVLSFTYNVGVHNFINSTLLRKLKEGNIQEAANQFLRWNKARVRGKLTILKGLTNRRKDERNLFLSE
jgi:lysozyme